MTRAIIGIPTKEGIACYMASCDGYFSGWGAELFYYFNNEKSFPKLIKYLYKYNTLENTYEHLLICKDEKEFRQVATEDVFMEYAYLFRNNKWYGGIPSQNKRWLLRELTENKVTDPTA